MVPQEVWLAAALLQIAKLAMPDTFFRSDSRCEIARSVLREAGLDPESFDEIINQ
jgi:hypothetical protein